MTAKLYNNHNELIFVGEPENMPVPFYDEEGNEFFFSMRWVSEHGMPEEPTAEQELELNKYSD
jgi:hypothetical protein